MKERTKGVKNRYAIQQALLSFVRKSLPDIKVKKPRVVKLMRKLKDINAVQKNIDNIVDEVVEEINNINVEILENKLDKLLYDKYVKVEDNKSKANKISNTIRKRIDRIKENVLIIEAKGLLGIDKDLKGKARLEAKKNKLAERIGEQNSILQDRIAQLLNGIELTEEQNNEAADYQLAIEINNSLYMGQNQATKVEALDNVVTNLESLIADGRSQLNDQLAEASQGYRTRNEYIYEDITGEKIDFSDPDSIEKAKKILKEREISKQKEEENTRFALTKILKIVKNSTVGFLRRGDSLQNIMDAISNLPGLMFEGRTQELVYDKINESSILYKQYQLEDNRVMAEKYTELFGGPKKVKGITVPLRVRKMIARQKIRAMEKPSLTFIGREGRKTKDGKVIYRDIKAVEKAEQQYKDAKGVLPLVQKL